MEVKSNDPDVVSVEKDFSRLVGSVNAGIYSEAKKNGIATIYVTFVSGGETIMRTLPVAVGPYIAIDAPRDIVINKGSSRLLPYSLNPAGTTDSNISWKSSNTKVATVSKDGVVKALSNGVAVITVTYKVCGYDYDRGAGRTHVSGRTLNRA